MTVVFLLLCSATGLAAEENPCLKRTIPVHVLDVEGKPVSGLLAENFRAKYRGKPVKVLSVANDFSSRRIVLLLDASASMTGGATWQAEQVLAADLMRFAPQPCSLALMVFASEVQDQDKVDFAQGPSALAKRLEALRTEREPVPKGHRKTALYDAILAGVAELKPARFGDVIYVTTDAGDNRSRSKPSEVERALVTQGVRLFAFLLDDFAQRATPEGVEGPRVLRGLVEHSGGSFSVISGNFWLQNRFSEGELVDILAAARPLYQEMRAFYRLEIELPEEVRKPRNWKLEVFTEREKKRERHQAFYPRLFPCNAGHGQVD